MPLRTLVLLLLVATLALFTALEWSAFMAPTTLSLAFATVEAPLGLIMLDITATLGTLFLLYLVYLRAFLDMRLQKLKETLLAAQARTDGEFRSSVERATNTLAAYIGEAEDRLERRVAGSGSTPA